MRTTVTPLLLAKGSRKTMRLLSVLILCLFSVSAYAEGYWVKILETVTAVANVGTTEITKGGTTHTQATTSSGMNSVTSTSDIVGYQIQGDVLLGSGDGTHKRGHVYQKQVLECIEGVDNATAFFQFYLKRKSIPFVNGSNRAAMAVSYHVGNWSFTVWISNPNVKYELDDTTTTGLEYSGILNVTAYGGYDYYSFYKTVDLKDYANAETLKTEGGAWYDTTLHEPGTRMLVIAKKN